MSDQTYTDEELDNLIASRVETVLTQREAAAQAAADAAAAAKAATDAAVAEAVAAQLKAMGIEAPKNEPIVLAEGEQGSTAERDALAAGAAADILPPIDPRVAAIKAARDVEAAGGRRDYAIAEGVSVLATAAANGDGRVIFNGEAWRERARAEASVNR